MKSHILLISACLFLTLANTYAQTKPRYYVVYSSCFCDPAGNSISSTGKEAYNLFISDVEYASIASNIPSYSNNGDVENKDKFKRRFLNQVKIDYTNWTKVADVIFAEGFSSEEEAADFRRKKMADEKTQRKSQLHTVSI
ncbi:hypothetical protein GCM10028805_36570 [Spirosoma harenae]